ncbi:hypothetical protein HYW82_00985 [Candidatus Peregrinibacteria bacterium]|nr:hypothetical protein [Candidatus Peregrinibacteria bacterium]
MGIEKNENLEGGPTPADLAQICLDFGVDADDCDYMAEIEKWDDALGYAYSALCVAGVDDPEAFLRERGILE